MRVSRITSLVALAAAIISTTGCGLMQPSPFEHRKHWTHTDSYIYAGEHLGPVQAPFSPIIKDVPMVDSVLHMGLAECKRPANSPSSR